MLEERSRVLSDPQGGRHPAVQASGWADGEGEGPSRNR